MIIRKHCAVIEDFNGCSICSLVGTNEFIYDSAKQTIREFIANESDERLIALVENGNVIFLRHYIEDIHDNTPAKNKAKAINKVVKFPIKSLLAIDFASREYCKEFNEQCNAFIDINNKLLDFVKKSCGGVPYVEE